MMELIKEMYVRKEGGMIVIACVVGGIGGKCLEKKAGIK